jgi:hypothetical protein
MKQRIVFDPSSSFQASQRQLNPATLQKASGWLVGLVLKIVGL